MSERKRTEVIRETDEPKGVFTKGQFLEASRYKENRDLLEALLNNEKKYSFKEADELIGSYMKGKVN